MGYSIIKSVYNIIAYEIFLLFYFFLWFLDLQGTSHFTSNLSFISTQFKTPSINSTYYFITSTHLVLDFPKSNSDSYKYIPPTCNLLVFIITSTILVIWNKAFNSALVFLLHSPLSLSLIGLKIFRKIFLSNIKNFILYNFLAEFSMFLSEQNYWMN